MVNLAYSPNANGDAITAHCNCESRAADTRLRMTSEVFILPISKPRPAYTLSDRTLHLLLWDKSDAALGTLTAESVKLHSLLYNSPKSSREPSWQDWTGFVRLHWRA